MTKQNKTAEIKSSKKGRGRAKPAILYEQNDDLFGQNQSVEKILPALGGDSVQTQAARLGDPRLQSVQRQTMAARVGQVQGNQHLHRVTSAVQRTPESRTPVEQANLTPISNLSNLPIQLQRSGRVGAAHYEENPRDVIAIRMPYNIGDFDAVLEVINRVVQQFGSSSRTYTNDTNFRLMLRSFLQEIGHPSISGGEPVMTRQRWLRLRIRLVRGEGRRINGLQLLRPQREVRVETPEVVESRERPEPSPPREIEQAPTEAPAPTAEQAPAEEGGTLSWIAGGAEALGNLASGRWVWNPITSQMAEWEAELDRIGEQGSPTTLGSVLIVPVSLLFVILQSIVGLLDLLARLNPLSLALRGTATGIRAAAGQYTREEFMRDAEAVGEEALDIITLGLRNAFRHLQEGIEEANAFRITQAVGEIVMAALAILGIFRGIRGASSAGRLSAAVAEEAAMPVEQVRPSAPTEPAGQTVRPSAPTEPAPEVRSPGRRTGEAQIGLRIERTFNTETVARQVRNEYVSGEARGGYIECVRYESFVEHWYESGGTGRPPLAFVDSGGTFVYDATRIGQAPPDLLIEGTRRRLGRRPLPPIRAAILDAEVARQIMTEHARRGGQVFRMRNPEAFRQSWRRFGGEGEPPIAFMNHEGVLMVNMEALGTQ